jgi:IS4 transposase
LPALSLKVTFTEAGYPDTLRRIRFKTNEGRTRVFLTNNFTLPALTITELYRCLWQVELFFSG